MFKLMRPCANCPFRKGEGEKFRMPLLRLREIRKAVAFQCHKTVAYDHFEDPEKRQGEHPQQCAGLMAVLHRINDTNTIMQIAWRLGELDLSKLDPDNEVYANWDDVLAAHCGAQGES